MWPNGTLASGSWAGIVSQWNPRTGKQVEPVFSCFNQDQKMDEVDWPNLNARLKQNSVQEKLSNLWLDYLLKKKNVLRV